MEATQLPLPNRNSDTHQLSFRDPAGRVFADDVSIIRQVNPKAVHSLQSVLRSKVVERWVGLKKLIDTKQTGPFEFRHSKIFYPTYPHEWTSAMLYEAGVTTLDLFEEALKEGYGLKDASSRNILYSGVSPVFIDLLSFEKRHPNDGTWLPFEQFLRHFIYPLALVKAKRSTLRSYFLSGTDGLSPLEVGEKMGLKAYAPRYFSLIAIPYWISKIATKKKWNEKRVQRFTSSAKEATFVLKILIKHLRKGLERVKPDSSQVTLWSDYESKTCPYQKTALENKEAFLKNIVEKYRPLSVLDLGCNQGKYSVLAAKAGAKVVSLDYDESCISVVEKIARTEKLDMLPVCMSLQEPSPGLGWKNRETLSFLERSNKKFDMTLSLALFHHLILQSLPLEEVLSLFSHTTHRYLVVEYVGPNDSQVLQGLNHRGNTIHYPTKDEFLAALQTDFKVVERKLLSPMDREIFLLEKLKNTSNS